MLADFWFDPSCPYSWITAQWLREVVTVRPVELRWHLMSLSVLNEGREDDPEGDPEGYLWLPVRICAAVEQEYGQDALVRFYTALAARVHAPAPEWGPDLFHSALAEAGLPEKPAEAARSTAYDEVIRASHAEGVGLVGDHVGTPIVAVTAPDGGRIAFFGPVISRVPRGEQAGRLWDGTLLVAGTPGFHEIKGPPADPDPFRST
ncbi:hypothetical protein SAMN04489712_109161 [Thermomonospora echinospora]|uniref:DSBA-like thioredoxin domain-containing protein n=1 Tax=Thermomonospora echinospora TaxID=1992 RepID=A0A1H6CCG0_9ACTN|nr:DsbA family protein [Thermomonospora echinospora]SEG70325.1 hypothetical protein SAMN04489712_109161 [Thermomonospora echinospora]